MADQSVVHLGENSPEHVAFRLLREVAYVEGKRLQQMDATFQKPDRQWILDTYAECLDAVRDPYTRIKQKPAS